MDQNFQWILFGCTLPTLQQGALISVPLLVSGITVRVCVLLKFPSALVHAIVAAMGVYLLWFFYSTGMVYFFILCGIVYAMLLIIRRNRGLLIGGVSLAFLLIWYVYG